VYTSNVIYESPVAYFDERTPYVVGIVHLDEDVYMFTEFVVADPEDVEIGMPVEVTFERVSEAVTLPKFRPS